MIRAEFYYTALSGRRVKEIVNIDKSEDEAYVWVCNEYNAVSRLKMTPTTADEVNRNFGG